MDGMCAALNLLVGNTVTVWARERTTFPVSRGGKCKAL